MKRRYPIYEIKWGDASIDTDAFTKEEAAKTAPIVTYTVGYLTAKNQNGYVLATDYYEEDKLGFATKLFIPHGMVLKVTKVG